ncbi:MAG: hypothetical protein JST84_04820 [Acidobacteria bacterium]|nr:hypothetical protein [Acidobacteriota bacterium]
MRKAISVGVVFLLLCALLVQAFGQATPGGTVISNQATATYQDTSGNTLSAVSNTVSVTVANVAGLTITPDGLAVANATPLTVKTLTYTVTNSGNFSQSVIYKASGASIVVTGPVTVQKAVIDLNGNGIIDATDTDIFTNGADVTSATLAQNGTHNVLVQVQVQAAATAGATITVNLGDTTTGGPGFDSQPTDSSANGVVTSSATAVNGILEAKGSQTFNVLEDAKIRVTLTAPAGPLTPGSDIAYSTQACNDSVNTPVTALTLSGGPAGNNSSVYIIAPIPANTTLKAGQAFPGSTLYTTAPLTVAPTAAAWTATAPATLSSVTRIAFATGSSLATGTCTASYPFIVTINSGVNPITVPNISEIVDAFGTNSLGTTITDQSGDPTPMAGDGNANFDEGTAPGSTDGNGVQQQTALTGSPLVYIGPQSNVSSTVMNNITTNCEHYDHTTWAEPDFSTLSGNIVVTSPKQIKNTGTIPFSFGLIQGNKSANEADTPNVIYYTGGAAGIFFDNAQDITTEVSFDGGATWKMLKSAAGLSSTTTTLTSSIHTVDSANVPFGGITLDPGQSVNFLARHTFPNAKYAGKTNLTVTMYVGLYFAGTQTPMATSYANVSHARTWVGGGAWGGTCPGDQIFDSTGDTIITGSADVVKSATTTNSTGVGGASDAVPGAQVTYTLTITGKLPGTTPDPLLTNGPWNVINRFPLQSSNVTITEDGNTAPNNWGANTTQVVGSASCTVPATITGDSAGSTSLTFQLTNPLTAGQVATCTFSRLIK